MHKETFYTKKDIKETTFALLSDIHYHNTYNNKILTNIVKQIKQTKPDYIVIVGDILDTTETDNFTNLETFLKDLSKISPVITVLGNHDEKAGSMRKWSHKKNEPLLDLLNNIDNIYLLRDNKFTKDNITFYGFDLSYKYYEVNNETYNSFCEEVKDKKFDIPEDTYNITLIHSPINIYNFIRNNPSHKLNNSNLILSGHMHNGCLPLLISNPLNKIFKTSRSIISPTKKFFPKYSQGRIYERDGYIYEGITKLSKSSKLFHLFNIFYHKQVTFITIKKEQ